MSAAVTAFVNVAKAARSVPAVRVAARSTVLKTVGNFLTVEPMERSTITEAIPKIGERVLLKGWVHVRESIPFPRLINRLRP